MQMSQATQDSVTESATATATLPVVIVGNGPAGMRAARELLATDLDRSVILYGREPWQPYNRVQLSSLLAGERDLDSLTDALDADERLEQRFGFEVISIDPEAHTITDNNGNTQGYAQLVLALGSRPHVPPVEGYDQRGVYTFRNLTDAEHLAARRMRSRRTVVIGGGLLGLEAARGMQKANTEVVVIDHADRLLNRQLDEAAGSRLLKEVEAKGITVRLNSAVKEIRGDDISVTGIELYNGDVIDCDTVIVATGITPNTELARDAGLAVGRGIVVDDAMRTSNADIYAVGECCEHNGEIYGLVAPGLEQATVASHHILGGEGQYKGSIAATRLKVLGENVFSIGPMADHVPSPLDKTPVYSDEHSYRRLLLRRGRLEGAIGIGEWPEQSRVLTAVTNRQLIMPWQLWRFESTGRLWEEDDAATVVNWPASATVCQCTGVTRGTIGEAIAGGCGSVSEVTACTGAGGVCGSCKPLVQDLLGADANREPVRWSKGLTLAGILSLLAALLFFLAPAIPYNSSVQTPLQWDQLWRNGLFKQISGFTILGLLVIGLVLSPRKRVKKLQSLGQFDGWRLFHIVSGVLIVAALLAHTGFRLGHGLNLWLMTAFTGLLLAGGIVTLGISQEHKLSTTSARKLRKTGFWLHLLLFWPVPALLGFHILKTYYF